MGYITRMSPECDRRKPLRILSLDGGGAKGFYTLGILKQLEAMLGNTPLSERFDLIFGTSTGAIIATLLALGRSVDEIRELYENEVPPLMRMRGSNARSAALEALAVRVFGAVAFNDMKTHIGIVAARWLEEKPMIFKTDVGQAHGSKGTFEPGFGASVADAVVASCSAYPIFNRKRVKTCDGDVELIDGGYCANNPTLYAIVDATKALGYAHADLRVVSLGVGNYPEPPKYWHKWAIEKFFLVRLLHKTLGINTHSLEQLAMLLCTDVPMVRISESFTTPDMAADLMEHNVDKLKLLYRRGLESFGKHERQLEQLLS
ncbi:patatin-like phospholipase family protein [Cupriavidus taiwanensis]|uniref:patatin-like phospholipase family protein n=1 Tax=Cupriavidus taiwanensis TaxID=164546 RepID=UPI000E18635C|nr:patatin-like phospholipase family protein [Cupriavidus taiwanensis]SPC18497.1 Patatin [Cupriavidus taiwanensis]